MCTPKYFLLTATLEPRLMHAHTSLRSHHMVVTFLISLFLPSCFSSICRADVMVGDAVIKEPCGDISHLKPPLSFCGRQPGRHSASLPIFPLRRQSPHPTPSPQFPATTQSGCCSPSKKYKEPKAAMCVCLSIVSATRMVSPLLFPYTVICVSERD